MIVDLHITKDTYRGYNKGLGNTPAGWFWETWVKTTGYNDIAWTTDTESGNVMLIHKPTGNRAVYTDKLMKYSNSALKSGAMRPVHICIDFDIGIAYIVKYLPGGLYLGIKMRLDTLWRKITVGLLLLRIKK